MLLSTEQHYDMFECNGSKVLHLKYEGDFYSMKLEYLNELQPISGWVSSIVNLDDTIETLIFPSEGESSTRVFSVTINVYNLNETCDYFIMKTLSIRCINVNPFDKEIYTEIIPKVFFEDLVNEKHIKRFDSFII